MKLMARDGKQIHAEVVYVAGDMPRGLHGIGMEQGAISMRNAAESGDVLNGTDLVVGLHDGDEHVVGCLAGCACLHKCTLKVGGGDKSFAVDRQHDDSATILFERLAGAKDGVMLNRACDDGERRGVRSRFAAGPVLGLRSSRRLEQLLDPGLVPRFSFVY